MQIPAINSLRAISRDQLVSLGSSLSVHLTLLFVLAMMVIPGMTASPEATVISANVDTVIAAPAELEIRAGEGIFDLEGPADLQALPGADGGISSEVAMNPDPVDALPQAGSFSPANWSPLGVRVGSLAEKVGPLNFGRGAGTGAGLGSGIGDGIGGSGTGSGRTFFGVQGAGDSVVFVVDASRSMYFPHPGPARTRFGRVKLELLDTISRMSSRQRFFIIFFNNTAVPMPAERLMEATPTVKSRYLEWMVNVPADGGTIPDQALLLALQLRPDVIYFLTDGIFDRRVVSTVGQANVSRIPIHTIGFGDDIGATYLQRIAADNGGRYKFIPPDEGLGEELAGPAPESTGSGMVPQ